MKQINDRWKVFNATRYEVIHWISFSVIEIVRFLIKSVLKLNEIGVQTKVELKTLYTVPIGLSTESVKGSTIKTKNHHFEIVVACTFLLEQFVSCYQFLLFSQYSTTYHYLLLVWLCYIGYQIAVPSLHVFTQIAKGDEQWSKSLKR